MTHHVVDGRLAKMKGLELICRGFCAHLPTPDCFATDSGTQSIKQSLSEIHSRRKHLVNTQLHYSLALLKTSLHPLANYFELLLGLSV